tara:strand:+ start:2716 stop:3648 length:933 start_codon:yes stop_codon:yes gene_type:complete
MKVFILAAQENWITDQLKKEWVENNKDIYTQDLNQADTIWILSNYIANQIPNHAYKQKRVITTIHHIVPWKTDTNKINHYKYLDTITDVFVTNQEICKLELQKYVTKEIRVVSLWNNEDIWKYKNKNILRQQYHLSEGAYIIGSFQRDTEGAGISSNNYQPKLEKGPDIFIEAIKFLKDKQPNLLVLLTGTRRQYVIQKLNELNINYYYFEMCDFEMLNNLYNCLDLYIVSSRVEGGPRAINECALTKTPIFSTNVGIASLICHPDSIFDMNNVETILSCNYDVDYNYNKANIYSIKNYMNTFNKLNFNE